MLKKLLKQGQAMRFMASSPATMARIRSVESSDSAVRAAEMLTSPDALLQLTPNEARVVVSYMKPRRIEQGTVFIREGDTYENDFLLLILSGEVSVETAMSGRDEPMTLSILGPGQLMGEMGLLRGGARSASCVALSQVDGAVLDRKALMRLTKDDPLTAAKLLMAIAGRMADRLRDSAEKLKKYSQLNDVLQQEIAQATRPAPPRKIKPPARS